MSIVINNCEPARETGSLSRATASDWRPSAQTATKRVRVAFVVNGDCHSAMAERARSFAARLDYDVCLAYRSPRKLISILTFFGFLLRTRPAVTYVFDIGYSGVIAAAVYRIIFGNRLIVDTGDAIAELAQSLGERGRFGIWLTALLEKFALSVADHVVVRGSFHRELLARKGISAGVIQDGVDAASFVSDDETDLRRKLGLESVLTVGLVGSSVWSDKLQICYGWELVETIRRLKDQPVKGVMIGGGSGIEHLKARCREYGIEDRILFIDRVPYKDLPRYLRTIDIALSTQTNDVVGNVRTTGKLPLYLASGRYILASDVGEASRVLPKEMLVDYEGVKDEAYPARLAARIESILARPETLEPASQNPEIARAHFEYSLLSRRVENVIAQQLQR